jgi:hypothetical protein
MELNLRNEDLKSLSDCTNVLKKIGFVKEFQLVGNGLKAVDDNKVYSPEEVKIIDHYLFKEKRDSSDMAILNVIETNTGIKGTLIAEDGPNANGKIAKFISRVRGFLSL